MKRPDDFKLMLMTAENRAASFREVTPKTNTRRVIVPQPNIDGPGESTEVGDVWYDSIAKKVFKAVESTGRNKRDAGILTPKEIKPRYSVGDRVGIREPYRAVIYQRRKKYAYGEHLIEYTDTKETIKCPPELDEWFWKRWHRHSSTTLSSLFMFKCLARKFIEITGVRYEELQKISEEDCLAEGIDRKLLPYDMADPEKRYLYDGTAIELFKELWNSINEKRGYGWDKNPWVWVYEYRKMEV